MDPRLVQRTRYLLQARVRRVKSCPTPLFRSTCLHLLDWLQRHPILGAVVSELRVISAQFDAGIAVALGYLHEEANANDLQVMRGASVAEHAALCWRVLDTIARADIRDDPSEEIYLRIFSTILHGSWTGTEEDWVDRLRDIAVESLYDFVDESIDSRNAIMGLLIKYKQRSEWFHRERLRAMAREGVERRRPGEESLAVDLQEYIFDQGVDFSIEPTSASGEADLVLRDVDRSYIVLDAKYIRAGASPSEFKDKIARGLHQVARYCHDFHEPTGYLVVFIEDTKMPRLPVESSDGFEYISVKGKHVYYIPVVIADAPSASRAGKAEEIDITEGDIIKFQAAEPGETGTE